MRRSLSLAVLLSAFLVTPAHAAEKGTGSGYSGDKGLSKPKDEKLFKVIPDKPKKWDGDSDKVQKAGDMIYKRKEEPYSRLPNLCNTENPPSWCP